MKKIWIAEFEPIYPVGGCLVIWAKDGHEALQIAKETIKHTDEWTISLFDMSKSGVVVYLSGDY